MVLPEAHKGEGWFTVQFQQRLYNMSKRRSKLQRTPRVEGLKGSQRSGSASCKAGCSLQAPFALAHIRRGVPSRLNGWPGRALRPAPRPEIRHKHISSTTRDQTTHTPASCARETCGSWHGTCIGNCSFHDCPKPTLETANADCYPQGNADPWISAVHRGSASRGRLAHTMRPKRCG